MDVHDEDKPANYALNGKIMLCSVIILFVVVFVIACFHSYVRLCFHRRHPLRRRRTRRLFSQNIISSSPTTDTSAAVSQKGLDLSVLKTLPSFSYSSTSAHDRQLECAVCLSEFEEGERGRVLPNCNHAFHIQCIDTWFKSNSNCPLCRCRVPPEVPAPTPENRHEVVITVGELAGGGEEEEKEEEENSNMRSPSGSGRREALDVAGMISMDERVARNFGWPKSHGPQNQTVTLKRIWSI